jgi:hypothetical protein
MTRRSGVETLAASDGGAGVAPVSTSTVYSRTFKDFSNVVAIGWEFTASGTGVDILVKLQISQDGTNFAVDTGFATIVNLTNTTKQSGTIVLANIPAAKEARLSFTGQGDNPADAAVTGYVNLIRDEG